MKPIIDPSTLTEEQREEILQIYESNEEGILISSRPKAMLRENRLLERLFGKDFFEEGGINEL